MASLYESTSRSRKIVIVILVVVVGYLGLDFLNNYNTFQQQNNVQRRFYMEYDGKFGAIPAAQIPGIKVNGNPNYTLESAHGSFPDVAYVYEINQPRETLQSFENALEIVDELGFDRTTSQQNGDVVTWTKDNGSKTLTYNRRLQQWELKTNYTTNIYALGSKTLGTNLEDYNSQAESVVSQFNFDDSEGFEEATVFSIFAAIGLDGIFIDPSLAQRSPEYVFVDVFKNLPYSDLKVASLRPTLKPGEKEPEPVEATVYTSDPRIGSARFVVSNRFRDLTKDLFEMYFTNFNYSATTGKYFVVTPDEAWNNVTQGKGSLVFIQPQNGNYFADTEQIQVTRFFADARQTQVGYWEPETWQKYVYPIYIFKGRAELSDGRLANFIIFIDAIKRV